MARPLTSDEEYIERIEHNGVFKVDKIIKDHNLKGGKQYVNIHCKACGTASTRLISGLMKDDLHCVICNPAPPHYNHSKYTIEDIQDKLQEFHIVCLDSKYINQNVDMQFKCLQCDHVWMTKYRNIIRGRKCPICSGTNSYGEQITGAILEVNNINYLYQKSVNIHGRRNIFDFWIVDQKGSPYLAIELDGDQHYDVNDNFYRGRQPDIDKNEYCYNHKIPMLRIDYKNYSRPKILSILSEVLKKKLTMPSNKYIPSFDRKFEMTEYSKTHSMEETSQKYNITTASIWNWFEKINGVKRNEWFKCKYGMIPRDLKLFVKYGIVEQYNRDNVLVAQYPSKYIASQKMNITVGDIEKSLNGIIPKARDYIWKYKKIEYPVVFIKEHLKDGKLSMKFRKDMMYTHELKDAVQYYYSHSLEDTLSRYNVAKYELAFAFVKEYGDNKITFIRKNKCKEFEDTCKKAVEYYKKHTMKETLRIYNISNTTLSQNFHDIIGVSHDIYKLLSEYGVIQKYDLEGNLVEEFYTLMDAAESIDDKTSNSNIRRSLEKFSRTTKGFHWKYRKLDNVDQYIQENIKNQQTK